MHTRRLEAIVPSKTLLKSSSPYEFFWMKPLSSHISLCGKLKKASTQPFPTLILLTEVVVREKGAARLLKHISSRSTHHLWTSVYTEFLFQKKKQENMTTTYLIFSPALWISILPFFSFQPSMRCSLWSAGPSSRHEAGAQKQAWRGELKLQWRKNSNQKTPQSKVFTGVDSTEAGLNTRTQKSPHSSLGELRNAEKQSRSHCKASVQAGLGGNHPTLSSRAAAFIPTLITPTSCVSSCALSPATTQAAAPPSGKNEHKERPEKHVTNNGFIINNGFFLYTTKLSPPQQHHLLFSQWRRVHVCPVMPSWPCCSPTASLTDGWRQSRSTRLQLHQRRPSLCRRETSETR